jgi:hypothetical protein
MFMLHSAKGNDTPEIITDERQLIVVTKCNYPTTTKPTFATSF